MANYEWLDEPDEWPALGRRVLLRFGHSWGGHRGTVVAIEQIRRRGSLLCENEGRVSRAGLTEGNHRASGVPRTAEILKRGSEEKIAAYESLRGR